MSTTARRFSGFLVLIAATISLSLLSRTRYVAEPASHAVLRMAWRTRGTRVRECRHRTPEEIARLPVHMREDEVCEGRLLPYALVVSLDSQVVDSEQVRPSGVREDRPLYVYREFVVAPGTHRVRVEFTRLGNQQEEPAHEEPAHPEHHQPNPAPARLGLDTAVALDSRDIALVTYDPDLERLVLRLKERS